MSGAAGPFAGALRRSSMPHFARVHLSGLLRDTSSGTLVSSVGLAPACRFHLVTSTFHIPDEVPQLPKSPFSAREAAGNVHVVNVTGTRAFVAELTELLNQRDMVVELCGHFHTELYSNATSKLFCPSVTLTLEGLWGTEEILRILHAPGRDTRDFQSRLRRLIFRHKPDFSSKA